MEPYCNEFIDDSFEKDQFKIPVISLERTFFEKLLILYSETNRPTEKHMPLRYYRHCYDVAMISKTDNFQTIITNKELFEEVRQFKMKYYRNNWSNLEECSLKNITIIANENRLKELRNDYEKMKDMFFHDIPTFEEVLQQLKIVQQMLHKI